MAYSSTSNFTKSKIYPIAVKVVSLERFYQYTKLPFMWRERTGQAYDARLDSVLKYTLQRLQNYARRLRDRWSAGVNLFSWHAAYTCFEFDASCFCCLPTPGWRKKTIEKLFWQNKALPWDIAYYYRRGKWYGELFYSYYVMKDHPFFRDALKREPGRWKWKHVFGGMHGITKTVTQNKTRDYDVNGKEKGISQLLLWVREKSGKKLN